MIHAPSIIMISMMALLALFAATILSKPWMRLFALGCAAFEIVMLISLVAAIR